MKLITVKSHQGEGQFPRFPKGCAVNILAKCAHYENWLQAEIAGYQVYVPSHFVDDNQLVIDYDPTELVIGENEVVELLELHYEWAVVKQGDKVGWLPCQILKSI
ncbi:hypothetical protein [Frederiksenia canicola]|uniref:SH3 domain-containing protein n=1 Tax=Frederiksenia canicola TaxID=123824 RepID=A0AAE6X4U4_9PAST|nr:hypothetical protein [Frederiksenia canicola]QIM64191.1 hypothetical protein A4G17_01345 [Frederiksenia canicola]RPE93729.1 hypothetical protein EDC49_1242 [Frederiksenia canicola]